MPVALKVAQIFNPLVAPLEITSDGADGSIDATGLQITSSQLFLSLRDRGRQLQLGILLNQDGLTSKSGG